MNVAHAAAPGPTKAPLAASRVAPLLALGAGALLACAFAPLGWWPLALLCPAALMALWERAAPRRAAWLGFCFGLGTFGLGTWWLYVSIHVFGEAPIWLTLSLVLALVGIMAAYYALLGYLAVRALPAAGALRWLVGLPCLWLLIEWLRGWLFTGFPWLSLGYSQTGTWLAGFAPVAGVYGISALLLAGSGALVALVRGRGRVRAVALAVLIAPWPIGAALGQVPWTRPAGAPLSVAIVQGATPENQKWLAANRAPIEALYRRLETRALGARLIVWPEAALPEIINRHPGYVSQLWTQARAHHSDILMGVLRENARGEYFNSLMTLAGSVSFYDKHHLVPFGEYFPVPAFVRSWLRLENLPYESFTPGPAVQPPITAAGTTLAPSICYEDAYGSEELAARRASAVLVNVTNDAWFGHSWARYQHFQIARMRAIEAQRPLIRAANNGISALIGAHGQVLAEAPQFRPVVLSGTIQPRRGTPPYLWYGNSLIVVLGLLGGGFAAGRRFAGKWRTMRVESILPWR